jgi:hypothetical protein
VKIVMCMREDFIGQLEDLAVSVPQIMNRRFRLGGLDPKQAEAAIREPAALDDPRLRTHRFSYSAGAVAAILTFFARDERGETVMTGPSIRRVADHSGMVERTILPGKTPAAYGRNHRERSRRWKMRRIVGDLPSRTETFETRTARH